MLGRTARLLFIGIAIVDASPTGEKRRRRTRQRRKLNTCDPACGDGYTCECIAGRRLFGAPSNGASSPCSCIQAPSPPPPPNPPAAPSPGPAPPPMPTTLLWFDGPNFDPQTKVWSDTSGNDYHTRNPYGSNFGPHNQKPSGTPTVDTHSNGLQYVVFKSDAWLAVPHSMFVRTMSAVIMAPDGQTSWSSFGSYLNRVSSRQCNFLFSHGTDKLFSDRYPTRAWRNGASLSSPYHHGPINNWFVFTLEVASGCGNDEYYLARSAHSAADIQIAEILAFGDVLSDSARGQVESYLGAKWGVSVSG